jgi:hypothetical protein
MCIEGDDQPFLRPGYREHALQPFSDQVHARFAPIDGKTIRTQASGSAASSGS